jgi:hypothetical protein
MFSGANETGSEVTVATAEPIDPSAGALAAFGRLPSFSLVRSIRRRQPRVKRRTPPESGS